MDDMLRGYPVQLLSISNSYCWTSCAKHDFHRRKLPSQCYFVKKHDNETCIDFKICVFSFLVVEVNCDFV